MSLRTDYHREHKKTWAIEKFGSWEGYLESSRTYHAHMRITKPEQYLWGQCRKNAKARGRICTITKADLLPLPTHCPILGIELDYRPKTGKHGVDNSPSVDRINNKAGYVPGNVIVVSWRANKLKGEATIEELEALATFYRSRT